MTLKREADYSCISLFCEAMQEETVVQATVKTESDEEALSASISLPTPLVQRIVNYLQAKPYGEVYILMNDLLACVNNQSLRG